jgi:phospholipase/carboxylesterase
MPGSSNPFQALATLRVGPSPRDAGTATILLHERYRSPEDILDVARRLELPAMPFLAVPAHDGTWYPESLIAPASRNQPHLGWALERIETIVGELEGEGVPRERVAFLGFSQGACLAAEYVLQNPRRWGALVAMTGGLLGPPGTTWEASGELAGTPVLLATSDIDEQVPLERVEATADLFREMGAAVDLRVYPGRGHLVSDDEVRAARSLLGSLSGAGKP